MFIICFMFFGYSSLGVFNLNLHIPFSYCSLYWKFMTSSFLLFSIYSFYSISGTTSVMWKEICISVLLTVSIFEIHLKLLILTPQVNQTLDSCSLINDCLLCSVRWRCHADLGFLESFFSQVHQTWTDKTRCFNCTVILLLWFITSLFKSFSFV